MLRSVGRHTGAQEAETHGTNCPDAREKPRAQVYVPARYFRARAGLGSPEGSAPQHVEVSGVRPCLPDGGRRESLARIVESRAESEF